MNLKVLVLVLVLVNKNKILKFFHYSSAVALVINKNI